MDSLNYEMEEDYGLKVTINNIYVEFEPMKIEDNQLIRKSFSPRRKIFGYESTPFDKIDDLIIPVEIDGIQTFSETLELIKVGKEKYRREKDLVDVCFIDSIGYDEEKYIRVKKSIENSVEKTSSYELSRRIWYSNK